MRTVASPKKKRFCTNMTKDSFLGSVEAAYLFLLPIKEIELSQLFEEESARQRVTVGPITPRMHTCT